MKRLLFFGIVCLSSVWLHGQTLYFVDHANGNDNNGGTTLATAWKTIQKACNAATPNSVVQIRGGVYNENIFVNVSGTPGNPITFTSYGTESAVIDGAGITASTMLRITDRSYLTFLNLTIQNLTGNNAKGILIENTLNGSCSDLVFKSITIKNIKWTANASAIPTSSNNAQGFIAYGGNGGISNITIDGCQIYNNVLGYSEALSLNGNVSGFSIKNCTIHDNTNIGIALAGNYGICDNPLADKARYGVVSNNICYKNLSPVSSSAGIYVDGGEDILIEKNDCHENGLGIEVGCEKNGTTKYIMVRDNSIYNNAMSGISVGGYSTLTTGQVLSSTFRNNTLFQNNFLNSGAAEISLTKLSNCIFEDNLICSNNQNVLLVAENIFPQTNNLLNYNCWFTPSGNYDNIIIHWQTSTFSSYQSYKNATLQDINSIYGNPILGYPELPSPELYLLATSCCINAGNPALAITEGETDINGNPRVLTGIIDIGASEFNPSLGLHGSFDDASSGRVAPNPFGQQTTIYSSQTMEDATLMVYDCQGKLVSERKNLSGKQIVLNRNDLNSGMYFYKITEANKLLSSGKLIVNQE